MATEVVADAPCGPACDLGVYISRVNRGDWFACHRRNLILVVALSAINEASATLDPLGTRARLGWSSLNVIALPVVA
jgi:hypothetical protein